MLLQEYYNNNLKITDDDLVAIEERCGIYMLRAVNIVLHYNIQYTKHEDVTVFYFGDGENTYSIDTNGHMQEDNRVDGLMVDSKVSKNNARYEVKAVRLVGGAVDIVDRFDCNNNSDNGGHITIHQLMIAAFKLDELLAMLGERSLEINHINGCRWCNRLSNLEITTSSDNKMHGAILKLLLKYKLYTADYDAAGFCVADCHKALAFFRPDYKPSARWINKNVTCGAHVRQLAHVLL
jgi:hypothetical protein